MKPLTEAEMEQVSTVFHQVWTITIIVIIIINENIIIISIYDIFIYSLRREYAPGG